MSRCRLDGEESQLAVVLPFGMRNPCREFLKYAAENANYRAAYSNISIESGDATSVMQASDPIAKFVTGQL